MPIKDGWEWALLIGAGYVATISLVRLMRRRRDAILEELRGKAEAERARQQRERKQEQRRKLRERQRGKAA